MHRLNSFHYVYSPCSSYSKLNRFSTAPARNKNSRYAFDNRYRFSWHNLNYKSNANDVKNNVCLGWCHTITIALAKHIFGDLLIGCKNIEFFFLTKSDCRKPVRKLKSLVPKFNASERRFRLIPFDEKSLLAHVSRIFRFITSVPLKNDFARRDFHHILRIKIARHNYLRTVVKLNFN